MSAGLTPPQQATLDFIVAYIAERSYPPTLQEIAHGIGINTKSTALVHVRALERKGYLEVTTKRLGMRVVSR